jgi:hypothetical protein
MQQLTMLRHAEFSAIANPNGFEKAKAGGQKYLKHLQNVSTKRHTKHWLYTVLANRFNVC